MHCSAASPRRQGACGVVLSPIPSIQKGTCIVTQSQLERSVAAVTGEARRTIRNRGFSLADPFNVAYDPEPDVDAGYVDWEEVAGRRYAQLAVH